MKASYSLALALLLVACAERQADLDDDTPLPEPTCMLVGAHGYFEAGGMQPILNEHDTTGTVCLCLTEDERLSRSRHEELNDLAYAECLHNSTLVWTFDSTDCQDFYESGFWLDLVYVATDEDAWMNQDNLDCTSDDIDSSCSVHTTRTSPLPLLAVTLLLTLRRRRSTHP